MNNYYPKITGSANPTFWDGECKPWLDAGRPNFSGDDITNKEWRSLRADILVEYNDTCANCGVQKNARMGCDHVMTRYEGGGNATHNLQLLCPSCNSRKGSLSLPKLQPWAGRLNKEKDSACMKLRLELSAYCKNMRKELKALGGHKECSLNSVWL
jgi:hypothetical protein